MSTAKIDKNHFRIPRKWSEMSTSIVVVFLGLIIVHAKNIRLGPIRLYKNIPKFQDSSRKVQSDHQ